MKLTKKDGLSAVELEADKIDLIRAHKIINKLYDSSVHICPVPYSFIKDDTLDTLNLVMQALGLYTFPTIELCDWLMSQIDDNPEFEPHTAIEICAGTGWIGRQLGIPITDIKNMESPIVQGVMLNSLSVPTIYTEDVEQLEASDAVRKYSPEIVIGSYVTSKKLVDKIDRRKAITINISLPFGGVLKHNLMETVREEIKVGVDIDYILRKVYKLILIVNLRTHMKESYLSIPHQTLSFPWLVTRGDITQSRILIFENKSWGN